MGKQLLLGEKQKEDKVRKRDRNYDWAAASKPGSGPEVASPFQYEEVKLNLDESATLFFLDYFQVYFIKSKIHSFKMFADASILVIIPLYFIFISKDWVPFQLFAVFATFVTLIATLIIPQSPKYLYSKGKFDESRKALQFIRKFNGLS